MELYLDFLDGDGPLRARLERSLREAVRSGRLAPGAALPASRVLAAELGISRGVVVEAYEQLTAEGFLVARQGSGTRVAEGPVAPAGARAGAQPAGSAGAPRRRPAPSSPAPGNAAPARVDLRSRPVPAAPAAPAGRAPLRFDLRPGTPELGAFPRKRWLAALAEVVRELPEARLGYGDPRGAVELREALAAYLGRARGVIATPDGIVATGGLRQALSLLWAVLAERGLRRVAVEEPGWSGQRDTVSGAGLEPVPIPVDADGVVVDDLEGTSAGAVVLTPANQYPTGAVLAPERRTALVEWARRRDAVIVEDDYDAQYRYDRDPVGSLQGLAPDITVHGGSASKILAPAVGIGWLVLPERLVDSVAEKKATVAGGGSALEQVAFARLLESGELDRHLRRMRRVYRRRRERVLRALEEELPGIAVEGAAAGLHVVVRLPAGTDEAATVEAARRNGVRVEGIGAGDPALLLGYGRLAEDAVPAAVRALSAALESPR